jgi:hypothetical protein
MNTGDPSKNPQFERRIREFLAALNSGGAPIDDFAGLRVIFPTLEMLKWLK